MIGAIRLSSGVSMVDRRFLARYIYIILIDQDNRLPVGVWRPNPYKFLMCNKHL